MEHNTPKHQPVRWLRPLITVVLLGVVTAGFLTLTWHWTAPDRLQDALMVTQIENQPQTTTAITPSLLPSNHALPVPVIPLPPARVISRITTTDPVVFITIDDGVFKPVDAADFIIQHQLPTMAFLTTTMVRRDPTYFERLQQQAGMEIENHTVNHPFMNRLPYANQIAEICHASDELQQLYGTRPSLFRPPYGEYNDETKRAAGKCGIRRLVQWSVVLDRGKLSYQTHGHLVPGDIVLLHFRPELKTDLEVLIAAAHARGLRFANLADYLPQ